MTNSLRQVDLQPINSRWVAHVLNGRGVKCPHARLIEEALRDTAPEDAKIFRERVMRLQAGTDEPQDLGLAASWISAIAKDAEQAQPPTAPSETIRTVSCGTPPRKFEKSTHIYASSGALCVERIALDRASTSEDVDAFHTLQIEMASALARTRFDWDKKIIFQLTKRELPLFAACLLGWCDLLTFGNHGEGRDKFFTVKNQEAEGTLYVSLKQGKRNISLPISGDELFWLISEALLAIGKNTPHLDSQAVLQMIKRVGNMHAISMGRASA